MAVISEDDMQIGKYSIDKARQFDYHIFIRNVVLEMKSRQRPQGVRVPALFLYHFIIENFFSGGNRDV